MKLICKVASDFNLIIFPHDRELLKQQYEVNDTFTCEIKQDTKPRALKEHHLYWLLMQYTARSLPENIEQLLGCNITDKAMHEICKAKFEVSTTAWSKMSETEFNIYFSNVIKWIATFFLKCDAETLIDNVRSEK